MLERTARKKRVPDVARPERRYRRLRRFAIALLLLVLAVDVLWLTGALRVVHRALFRPWTELSARGPTVVRDEQSGRFMMWYHADLANRPLALLLRSRGFDGLSRLFRVGRTRGICLATSADGRRWTKSPHNPLLTHAAAWPTVLYDPKAPSKHRFRIWYNVRPGTEIRCAWSADGVHWEGRVAAIRKGRKGAFDDLNVAAPSVVRGRDGTYLMYYDAGSSRAERPAGFDNHYIALATSADGEKWTKRGVVLRRGREGRWDAWRIHNACVLYDPAEDIYEMWYAGASSKHDMAGDLGYAASVDGVHWAKSPDNPSLPQSRAASSTLRMGPVAVLKDGSGYHVWFGLQTWIEFAPHAYASDREAAREAHRKRAE